VYIVFEKAPMNSREIIRQLTADGWFEVNQVGSHKQFKHPEKKGRVTVVHPKRDVAIGTLKKIEKQSGIKFR
jgi:predicted RNA binding protein YcfA (HicA-like mRNA interferase family)